MDVEELVELELEKPTGDQAAIELQDDDNFPADESKQHVDVEVDSADEEEDDDEDEDATRKRARRAERFGMEPANPQQYKPMFKYILTEFSWLSSTEVIAVTAVRYEQGIDPSLPWSERKRLMVMQKKNGIS
jgi:hypothetical protein